MKNNKKSLFAKVSGVLALLTMTALIFAGCVQNFDGTKINFEQKKEEITSSYGTANPAWSGKVSVPTGPIDKASKNTQIEVVIDSPYELDMTTIDAAVSFYKLKDNTDNAAYYPMHDGDALKKELLYSDSFAYSSGKCNVATTFTFIVNTEDVTTNYIAVIVDATKLKDTLGNFVLNLDKNYKAGEESDSFIDYIGVTADKDGTPITSNLTALSAPDPDDIIKEDFRAEYNPVNPLGITVTSNSEDASKKDIFIPAGAPVTIDPSPGFDKSLADTMKASFKLRTTGLDKTSENVDLDWGWIDSPKPGYKATTPELAYGTTFTVVMTMPEITAPDWYSKVYGHPGFTTQYEKGATMDLDDLIQGTPNQSQLPVTTDYLKTEPDGFIVSNFGDSDNSTWSAGITSIATITGYQKALLNVSRSSIQTSVKDSNSIHNYYYYKWEISPKTTFANPVVLDAYDDFIVVKYDSSTGAYDKVEIEKEVVTNSDGTLRTIYITTKYPVSGAGLNLWVGSGTTLKENKAYTNQKKFGTFFKDASKGDASGYVQLTDY